jgi:solute carrier family 25 (mitochondrial folate transporter), member 32
MTASMATYPHEVLRTRLQTHRHPIGAHGRPIDPSQRVPGIIQAAKLIIRDEGWRSLYRGLSINLVRTVPNSAVTMVT